MTIKNNISTINDLLFKIETHPMCAELQIIKNHYRVLFPFKTTSGLHGVVINNTMGKIKALKILYEKCEDAWKEDQ